MRRSFEKLEELVLDNLDVPHFYEQSGANVFFNKTNMADTVLLTDIVDSKNIKTNRNGEPTLVDHSVNSDIVITHFCGIGYHPEKIKRMKRFWKMVKHNTSQQ